MWIGDDPNVVIDAAYEGKPVTRIAGRAFEAEERLESVVIPDSVKEIGYSAFSYCGNLTQVQFSRNLEIIDDEAFRGCVKLQEAVLPDSVQGFGRRVFGDCTALRSFYIPKAVRSMHPANFRNCISLEGFTISPENEYYMVEDGVLYTRDQTALLLYPGARGGRAFTIPETVKGIEEEAFGPTKYLREVTIPKNLTTDWENGMTIDGLCFMGNTLENFFVEEGNAEFASLDGVLYTASFPQLLVYPGGRTDATYVMPEGSSFGQGAFSGNQHLTYLEIPESASRIPNETFRGCHKLEKVKLPSTLYRIGDRAFFDCVNLREIDFPGELGFIGESAFAGCDLRFAYIPGTPSLDYDCFSNNPNLRTVVLSPEVDQIAWYAFQNCDVLETVVIPGKNVEIGSVDDGAGADNEVFGKHHTLWREHPVTLFGPAGGSAQRYEDKCELSFRELRLAPAGAAAKQGDAQWSVNAEFRNYTDAAVNGVTASAALYDENGVLCGVKQLPLVMDAQGQTKLAFEIETDSEPVSGKLFVWGTEQELAPEFPISEILFPE